MARNKLVVGLSKYGLVEFSASIYSFDRFIFSAISIYFIFYFWIASFVRSRMRWKSHVWFCNSDEIEKQPSTLTPTEPDSLNIHPLCIDMLTKLYKFKLHIWTTFTFSNMHYVRDAIYFLAEICSMWLKFVTLDTMHLQISDWSK